MNSVTIETMLHISSLALFVLLVSTFGHDVLIRHQPSHLSRTHQGEPSSEESSLKLLTNSSSNLVAVLNATAELVQIFDASCNYAGVFCGSTGSVILVDLNSRNGLFIAGNSSHIGWFGQSQTFDEYFKSLSSLKSLYECSEKNGKKFTVENVSPGISLEIKLGLVAHSRKEYYVVQDYALVNFIRFSTIIVESLKGPLDGVLKLLPNGAMSIGVSARGVISIFEYLGKIVCNIQGGVSVLQQLNLDWKCIFNPKSTSENFIYIFSKLSEHNVDIKSIARNYADDSSVLIVGLAGNSSLGTSGALQVLAEVKGVMIRISGADALLETLLQYYTRLSSNCTRFDNFVKEMIKLGDFLTKTGLASVLPNKMSFIQGIQRGNFVDNGVDVYQITQSLFDTNTAPLQNIMKILSLLTPVLSLDNFVGDLLYRLILLVTDRHVNETRTLIPSIKIDSSMDFLVYVFRGAKVVDLTNNFYEFLRCRPVIGQMLEIIDSSLRSCNQENLQQIIQSESFCESRCLIIKLLERVIEDVNTECGNEGGGSNRYLKSRHDASTKHLKMENEQQSGHFLRYHEKHHKYGKYHRKRHGHEKQHKARSYKEKSF